MLCREPQRRVGGVFFNEISYVRTRDDGARARRVSAPSTSSTNGLAKKSTRRLSYLTFALIAHTTTRDDVIDARRRTRTHPCAFSSRITGFQSHRPRSTNTRRRFASSDIGSCAKIGDDSERAVAGVARRDEAVNDAARAGRVRSKHSDRNSTLVSAV